MLLYSAPTPVRRIWVWVVVLWNVLLPVPADCSEPPRAVVSINLCVDQLAILVAADGQLRSVTNLAFEERGAALADRASSFVPNNGSAEEVLLMEPDLVLAGAYTTRATVELLRRLGFRVEEFEPASSFDDVRANLRRMGELLGRGDRAEELVSELDRGLGEVADAFGSVRPLGTLYSANSFTSGRGTLADAILTAAGFDNVASGLGISGVGKLPLELLVMIEPDLIVAGRPWSDAPALADENLAHPALAGMRSTIAATFNAHWVCGGPFTSDAVRELARIRDGLPNAKASSQ